MQGCLLLVGGLELLLGGMGCRGEAGLEAVGARPLRRAVEVDVPGGA